MSYQNILLQQKERGIFLLTVNRPKSLNALNSATLDEIDTAITELAATQSARTLLITGAGEKAFVAGADIVAMQNFTAVEARAFSQRASDIFRKLEMLPMPTIALVNGYCLGGGNELAMSCDWILAAEHATFGQPEVNLGVTTGFGGSQRLLRLVGKAMAIEMLVTGRQIKADEALRIGLVNHVYAAEHLMDKGLETAKIVASKAPIAVSLSKRLVQHGQNMDLAAACAYESEIFGLTFATQDQKEGMAAFVEKRNPNFIGE